MNDLGKTRTQSYNDWLNEHDLETRADERMKVLEEITNVIKQNMGYSWISTSDILEAVEQMKGEQT